MTFDVLQWGALGLLAVVLVGIGLYLRDRDQKAQAFLQDLIVAARNEAMQQTKAWQDMTRQMVQSQVKAQRALEAIQLEIETHSRQVAARDEMVAHTLRKICERLDAN